MKKFDWKKTRLYKLKEWIDTQRRERYISLFTKSVAAMIVIGVLSLMLMGMAIYNAYQGSLQTLMLSNMYRTTLTIGRNIHSLLDEMEENTTYLYSAQSEDYGYIYELLADSSVGSDKKTAEINDMLRNILYRNQYIDHVFLIFPDGEICSAMRSPERMVNTYVIGQWYEETYTEHSRKMQLLPVHQADYYIHGDAGEGFYDLPEYHEHVHDRVGLRGDPRHALHRYQPGFSGQYHP